MARDKYNEYNTERTCNEGEKKQKTMTCKLLSSVMLGRRLSLGLTAWLSVSKSAGKLLHKLPPNWVHESGISRRSNEDYFGGHRRNAKVTGQGLNPMVMMKIARMISRLW